MTEAAIADWDLYRLFFAVAETKSISKAAARVGVSQPTLSRRMAELENHLGLPLLYRTSSGVTMTSEGKRLYHHASAILGSFEDFERDFRSEAGERGTLIRISASEGVTRYWLLPRLKGYIAKHAALRFEVAATVETLSVIDHDLDFVIRLGNPLDPELVGRKAARLVFDLFASRDYLASHPRIRRRADLNLSDVVAGGTAPSTFAQNEAARLRIGPLACRYAAVTTGIGPTLMPVPFALAEGLIEILPHEARFEQDIWLLRRREAHLRKPHKDFARFLERELTASRAWLSGEG
jgi:DNA-binding transcriptional LysR family regulator